MPGLLNPAPRASDDPSDSVQLGLEERDLELYQKATGIEDRDALARHIGEVKREASEILSSVNDESLIKPVLARLPGYDRVLKIGRSRKNPIFLGVGSRLGVDARKAIADGYPQDSVIATEPSEAFLAIGEKLFNGSQGTARVSILLGDPFDPYFLEAVWPFYTQPNALPPALSTLKSLNPLHGQVSVISACFVFDQLSALQQLQLARGLAGLLSAEPGSLIIGVNRTLLEQGRRRPDDEPGALYDSPESWSDLWDGQLFQKGTVKVETKLQVDQSMGVGIMEGGSLLEWTVTRL
ncbi:hypothetical protein C8T65DRAFT_659149 [Cerioporus squamosus]|nr:hypothetical protein C8T65DRAFT_659149 [Cerioporus squamosus]